MKLPSWGSLRDPMCWFLGAGVFVYLVATDNPNPVFIGVVVGLLGIPGVISLDDARRKRRESRNSVEITRPKSLGPSSSSSSSSSSTGPGDS